MLESKDYYIDLINSSKANKFTSQYHYSGVGFKKAKINQGIYRKTNNLLVGVLQWGVSAQEGVRLDRYVKEPITKEQYLELNRFCMADSEKKNSESQAISLGIKWIKKNCPDIKLLVSYAGRKEGNYGYIYQATNWEYLGYFISDGFWVVDGQEKHSITLWYYYKKYCDTSKDMRTALCEKYHNVKQTWTKQFIYVQRLDKKLTLASELLPYPKPSNEYPICTKEKIYKEDKNFICEVKNDIPIELFYYEKEKNLFSRACLRRRGEIGTNKIAIYNSADGELETICTTLKEAEQITSILVDTISNHIKSGKPYKGYFFKRYDFNDEVPTIIQIKYLCKIDGLMFFKQQEVADYCGVSRQSVSESTKRKSKVINGKIISWYDEK